jgi:hypothetical protein
MQTDSIKPGPYRVTFKDDPRTFEVDVTARGSTLYYDITEPAWGKDLSSRELTEMMTLFGGVVGCEPVGQQH